MGAGNLTFYKKIKTSFKEGHFAQNHKILSKIPSKIDHKNPYFSFST